MNRRSFLSGIGAISLASIPIARPIIAQQNTTPITDPMLAAERLSELECATYIPVMYQFYGFMHPDAAQIVPRATVIGWYQSDFHPRGPQPAKSTGVTMLDSWTWGVTGKTYTNVAEVSFTQYLDDGSVDNDVVRLVQANGEWCWFFGRDRAWVDEQNARFDQRAHVVQNGEAPYSLGNLTSLEPTLVQLLPHEIYDASFRTNYRVNQTDWMLTNSKLMMPKERYQYDAYEPKSEFGLGTFELGSILQPKSEAENLDAVAFELQNTPPVEIHGWNTKPTNGPAWIHVTHGAVDVVGPKYEIILVSQATYASIGMYSEEALASVAMALGEG